MAKQKSEPGRPAPGAKKNHTSPYTLACKQVGLLHFNVVGSPTSQAAKESLNFLRSCN